jgi:ParB family chromosome partitioning protein
MTHPRRTALGRGLSALIPEAKAPGADTDNSGIVTLPIEQIRTASHQPRTRFAAAALESLADSIRVDGLLQPIVVRKTGATTYTIVAGERRYRAATLAGIKEVPTLVRDASEQQAYELALIENIQREDLDPLEEAQAYRYLQIEHGMTQDQIAQRVGRDRVTVSNTMRILRLPESVRDLVAVGALTAGHARAILGAPESDQADLAERAASGHWNVRKTELEARRLRQPEQPEEEPTTPKDRGGATSAVEAQLRAALGAPVRLHHKDGKGRIEIRFHNLDELERLLGILGRKED